MKLNKAEIREKQHSCSVGEACTGILGPKEKNLQSIHLHSDLLQALKENFVSSGFSTEGTFISASAVHC